MRLQGLLVRLNSGRRMAGVLLASLTAAACCLGVSSADAAGVIRTIPVGSLPEGVSSDGTHVWVTNEEEETVREIEASSGNVIRTIPLGIYPVGSYPVGVSSDGTHVWVTNPGDDTVSEILASSGTVIGTIPVGANPVGVSSDGTHVWVATDDSVTEILASSGTVIRTIPVGGVGIPPGISSDGTHVWVAIDSDEDLVGEIEASSGNLIRTIRLGSEPRRVSSDGTHVWVTTFSEPENTVSEIEASSGNLIRTIPVGRTPDGVSSDGTRVWVTNSDEDTVSEILASSGNVIRTIPVGVDPVGVSSDGTHVWVTNEDEFHSEGTVSEILAIGPECTSNTGTVTLSPGLTDTAAVQTMKIEGALTGCVNEPFTEAGYTATLKMDAVSCSVLRETGAPATGTAKYKWTPKAKASAGTLRMPLTQTAGVSFSGGGTAGSYSPFTLSGVATESFTGGAECGEKVGTKAAKAVKKGAFVGSAVNFE
jgi:YVTN family beta-propeller protein